MTENIQHNIEITLLGTGSSGGVPRVGGDWGACDPNEPRNRRRRCSLLVEYWQGSETNPAKSERTIVLVDTAPDLREQLLDAQIDHIDAVLYTHDHGDQTHGIDDLRAIAYRKRGRIPVYMSAEAKENLYDRFLYCFELPKGRVHPPILDLQPLIAANSRIEISGAGGTIPVHVFEVGHGNINALGFIFADRYAYSPDARTINNPTLERLTQLDIWIVDALRYHSHPTHAHADQTLLWAAQTRVKQIVLTNMHVDMDYKTLCDELPGNQVVGYDGYKIRKTY